MKATIKTDKITKAAIRINLIQKEIQIDPNNLIKLSQVQKLDNIPSWSVLAWFHCPAKTMENGEISPACKGCYALSFEAGTNYSHTTTIKARLYNAEAWKHPDFVNQMLRAIQNHRYFRVFDSGDFYTIDLAVKWLEIMEKAYWCNFWVPTRMYRNPEYRFILDKMNALPNVRIRFSSDSINGDFSEIHGSTIIKNEQENTKNAFICPATKNESSGNCEACRVCWDKNVPVVAYVAHGKAIDRQYK